MPTWDVGRGTTKESYEAGRVGDHRTRGRQDPEGSGYWDRPANRQVLQDQQARINRMQSRGEGLFARGRTTQPKQGFLSGIGQKFKDWAGNIRGGINPLTNEYYTQDEYEDNVWNRRDQASIDRIRKTKGLYDTGVIDRDWDQSPLKNRLAGLEAGQWDRMNAMGTPIGTTKPGEEVAEEMIYPQRKPFVPPASEYEGMWDNRGINQTNNADEWFRNNPEVAQMMRQSNAARRNLPITERWENQTGMDLQEARAINPALTQSMPWYDNPLGYQTGNFMRGLLATQDPLQEKGYVKTYNTLGNSDLTIGGALKGIQGGAYDKLPSGVQEKFQEYILNQIEEGGGYQTGDKDIFEKNYSMGAVDPTFQGGMLDIEEGQLEKPEINYPQNFRTYQSLFAPQSIAQGGRVGYNTGGRVGILSIF